MRRIDLNVDLGEGCPNDDALLALASSANVCAGAHAGSPARTHKTIALAQSLGVTIGAHPGFPDPGQMGRSPWPLVRLEEAEASLNDQLDSMIGFARYLKPHGAFYNQSASEAAWSELLARLASRGGFPLYGLPGTLHERAAERADVRFVPEGFAERGYLVDGRLVPRGEAGATIETPQAAARQAVSLAARVETICVHGDRPDSVAVLHAVREAVIEAGYEVRPCV
ncbi:MAG: 5-oxoprolinase subunit PxpA [Fimbriimonadaceae bacterium]